MYGYGMGWWWLSWLFALLLLAGLVVLVIVAVRLIAGGVGRERAAPSGPGGEGGGRSTARQILDERYARGELTTQEYQERLSVLGEGPPGR